MAINGKAELVSFLQTHIREVETGTISRERLLRLIEFFIKDAVANGSDDGQDGDIIKYAILGAYVYRFIIGEKSAT